MGKLSEAIGNAVEAAIPDVLESCYRDSLKGVLKGDDLDKTCKKFMGAVLDSEILKNRNDNKKKASKKSDSENESSSESDSDDDKKKKKPSKSAKGAPKKTTTATGKVPGGMNSAVLSVEGSKYCLFYNSQTKSVHKDSDKKTAKTFHGTNLCALDFQRPLMKNLLIKNEGYSGINEEKYAKLLKLAIKEAGVLPKKGAAAKKAPAKKNNKKDDSDDEENEDSSSSESSSTDKESSDDSDSDSDKKPPKKEDKKPPKKDDKKEQKKNDKKPAKKQESESESESGESSSESSSDSEEEKPAKKPAKKEDKKEEKKPAKKEDKKPSKKDESDGSDSDNDAPKKPAKKEEKKPAKKEEKKEEKKDDKKPANALHAVPGRSGYYYNINNKIAVEQIGDKLVVVGRYSQSAQKIESFEVTQANIDFAKEKKMVFDKASFDLVAKKMPSAKIDLFIVNTNKEDKREKKEVHPIKSSPKPKTPVKENKKDSNAEGSEASSDDEPKEVPAKKSRSSVEEEDEAPKSVPKPASKPNSRAPSKPNSAAPSDAEN